jgi:glycosyltransferase involved in cell wall biosynthesis
MGEMVQNKYGLDGKYILSVSTIEPRKNFPVLFRAWQKIKKPFAPMVLVIVGGGKPHFRKVFPENDEDVIFLGRVPDEHLPSLYAGASAFIYPSVYEGFGLPILEAMACGVPVIASNCTAIPEVVGPAGILVDPVDADGLAEAIKKLLSDRTLRDQMAMLGKRRAASYSWKATADRIWDVLSNLFCFEA